MSRSSRLRAVAAARCAVRSGQLAVLSLILIFPDVLWKRNKEGKRFPSLC